MAKENKILTEEELNKILSEHNITFSDIAKIALTIKANKKEDSDDNKIAKTTKKSVSSIKYEITKLSYPDFVITKTSSIQTKELVVAPSCDGYFIRTLRKSGVWDVEELTGDNYALFMSDVSVNNLITLPTEFYVNTLERGKVFGASLLEYLHLNGIKEMIKDKCAPKFDKEQFGNNRYFYIDLYKDIRRQIDIYRVFPLIYKEYANSPIEKISKTIKCSPGIIMFIYTIYGIEKTKDFIRHMNLCLYETHFQGGVGKTSRKDYEDIDLYNKLTNPGNIPESDYIIYRTIKSYLPYNLPIINMNYEKFKEYILYESWRMGYNSLLDFLCEWADTLYMEYYLFGKIKEKYPKDLPIYHKKLIRLKSNYKYYKNPEFIDNFINAAENNKKYIYKPEDSEYEYIVPLTVDDVVKEADQQSNCLVNANYMQRVIDKTSILVFMRKKYDPDNAFVTMEIVENRINQAYLASNKIPLESTKREIRKYAKHFDLEYQG